MPLTISKITQVHKNVKKPSKLAVRKNIRRSSILDKGSTITENSIILIDSDGDDANENVDNQFDGHVNILDELYGEKWKKTTELIFVEPNYNNTLKNRLGTTKLDKKQLKSNVEKQANKNIKETVAPSQKKTVDKNISSKENPAKTIKGSSVRSLQRNKTCLITNNRVEEKAITTVQVHQLKGLRDDDSPEKENQKSNFTGKIRKKLDSISSDSTSSNDSEYSENSDSSFAPEEFTASSEDDVSFIVNEKSKNCKISPKLSVCAGFLDSLSPHITGEKCDPSARVFKDSYQANKTQLAEKLFQLYNEKIFNSLIPKDTPLIWNKNLRKTGGQCYQYSKKSPTTGKIERTIKITLSVKVLDEAHRLRDVLLHEMCHAACFIINRVKDGHGEIFQSWGRKAGKLFPELPPVKRCHLYKINTKYSYRCLKCGLCYNRHSKSIDMTKKCCGKCHGRFELLVNKFSKGEKKSVPVPEQKPPTGFALFVKNNYAAYKTPQLKHGDIMKLLGSKFNELKLSVLKESV